MHPYTFSGSNPACNCLDSGVRRQQGRVHATPSEPFKPGPAIGWRPFIGQPWPKRDWERPCHPLARTVRASGHAPALPAVAGCPAVRTHPSTATRPSSVKGRLLPRGPGRPPASDGATPGQSGRPLERPRITRLPGHSNASRKSCSTLPESFKFPAPICRYPARTQPGAGSRQVLFWRGRKMPDHIF